MGQMSPTVLLAALILFKLGASSAADEAMFLRAPLAFASRTFVASSNNVGVWVRSPHRLAGPTSRLLSTHLLAASNPDIVAARLEKQTAKRAARARSLEDTRQRNLRLKNLIHTEAKSGTNAGDYPIPSLYAVRVSVCQELRRELRMNGREKRGRLFVEVGSEGCKTLKGIKFELHSFFRVLKKSTYTLSAALPQVGEDGSIVTPPDVEKDPDNSNFIPLVCDEDVDQVFQLADKLYGDSSRRGDRLKRPSLLLHVRKDPNAPPPPPPPKYLEGMADPSETESMTMLSFYAFPPEEVADPEEFADSLRKKWKAFGALGRVYVAHEGVNAQMSVPTNVIDNFLQCCRSIQELGDHMENGINIDPIPLSMEEFEVAGDMNGKLAPPFKALHVRVRNQIVADGLDKSLDWQSAGYDMPPMEWHKKLKEARYSKLAGTADDKKPLIFDCRNNYETSVGTFEGSQPLETENFRDSWEVLKEKLDGKPKDTPIMTFCTGGIRCVKVGAYLSQEMGFTNVSRLAGGIIAYDRSLNEETEGEESMFKGVNYVFDGRVGRQITGDALGKCITCGAATNLLSNCANGNCHKRMVQCETCRTAFLGTCSDACKQRVINSDQTSRLSFSNSSIEVDAESCKYSNLDDYSSGHTSPSPSFYREIEQNTIYHLASGSHMVSGASQGRLLTQLASMTREGRVLELGAFTGYATCCLLEGCTNAGEAIGWTGQVGNRSGGPFVMSLERDSRAINIAASHLKIMSEYGLGGEAADQACKMRGENPSISEVLHDTVATTYNNIAGCELIRVTDALATVEEMARGDGAVEVAPFDLVFVDADKTRLLDYVEACASSDRLLKKGGLIVVDNVLWKGLVLNASGGGTSEADIDEEEKGMNEKDLKKSRRARKLAGKFHAFNEAVVRDDRLEVVMLPMRDGLSIMRKK